MSYFLIFFIYGYYLPHAFMLIYVCGIDKRCGILINFGRCPNLRKLWERYLPGMVKRKSDCRLTTSDFTACLGDKKIKGVLFVACTQLGLFEAKRKGCAGVVAGPALEVTSGIPM